MIIVNARPRGCHFGSQTVPAANLGAPWGPIGIGDVKGHGGCRRQPTFVRFWGDSAPRSQTKMFYVKKLKILKSYSKATRLQAAVRLP